MNHLKKPIVFFIVVTVVWIAMKFYLAHMNPYYGNKIIPLNINNQMLYAEVVLSQEKLEKGLGGRESMCSSCGMLFEFQRADRYDFWMKDMRFPLDIVWILQQKVVHVEKNVKPSFSGILVSPENADMVLELNAGSVDKLKIKEGDRMNF